MKIRKVTYCLFLFFTCCAQGARAQLLWEISGNNTTAHSYLLATNKYIDQTFLDSIDDVFAIYGRCDKVVTALSLKDHEAIAALRQAALLPDSVVLSQIYNDEDYKTIDFAMLSMLHLGLEQLGRMKPSYLTELYRDALMQSQMGYNSARTMETFFANVAEEQGKTIYGLDEVGEAIFMQFDREPWHYQYEQLKKVITSPEREVALEKAIRQAYRNGRLNDIAYQLLSPDNHTSVSYSDYQVWAQRNREWVKRLQPFLKDGKAFITLDAAYLGGEKGLLACLREKGYKVRPAKLRK